MFTFHGNFRSKRTVSAWLDLFAGLVIVEDDIYDRNDCKGQLFKTKANLGRRFKKSLGIQISLYEVGYFNHLVKAGE